MSKRHQAASAARRAPPEPGRGNPGAGVSNAARAASATDAAG